MATISVVLGVTLAGMGVAGAASKPSQFAVIKFIPSQHEVTLLIPTPPCRHGPPGCVWRLWVDEPFAPGAPQLGEATGTSGVLTVTYPSTVCGTVQGDASVIMQADVSVGGPAWRFEVGHRMAIPCPTGAPTTPTAGVTQLPNTGPSGPGGTTGPDPTTSAVKTAALAQLPFTGIDLTPMALIGMTLVLAGMLLAMGLEGLRRLPSTLQVQRARASRASHWFLGD